MVDSSAGMWAVAPFNVVSLSSEGIAVIEGWLAAFSLSVSHFALFKGCIPLGGDLYFSGPGKNTTL